MNGRRQNLAFLNGRFQDPQSITIRIAGARVLNQIIFMNPEGMGFWGFYGGEKLRKSRFLF